MGFGGVTDVSEKGRIMMKRLWGRILCLVSIHKWTDDADDLPVVYINHVAHAECSRCGATSAEYQKIFKAWFKG